MLALAQWPARHPGRGSRGCFRTRLPHARTPVVRCLIGRRDSDGVREPPTERSGREKAAVWVIGLAATCLALNPEPALADPNLAAKSKEIEAELQAILAERGVTLQKLEGSPKVGSAAKRAATVKYKAKLQAELARENAEVEELVTELEASMAAEIQSEQDLQARLDRENANTQRLVAELEATRAAAARSEEALQALLARENAEKQRLISELEATKAAAMRNEAELQARLAKEREETLRLIPELEAAKREVELQRQLQAAAASQQASLPAEEREAALEAELAREVSEVQKLVSDLSTAQAQEARSEEALQAQLARENAASQRLERELEAAREAEVKREEALQAELAREREDMWRLRAELEASMQEVESERRMVAMAKEQLLKTQQQATEAAAGTGEAAAASEEAVDTGEDGGISVQTAAILGAMAAAGGLAGYLALSVKPSTPLEMQQENAGDRETRDRQDEDVVAVHEQARGESKSESESLRRELSAMKEQLQQVAGQLTQERSQSDSLRKTMQAVEAEYARLVTEYERLERSMLATKSEAWELQRKLEEVIDETPAPQPPPSPQPVPEVPQQEPQHAGTAVLVRVTLQKELPFGQSLKLVGSDPALGGWDESKGLQMVWGDGHVWSAEVPLPPGAILEFKCVCVTSGGKGGSQWEQGPNHVLLVPISGASSMAVQVEWGAGKLAGGEVLDEEAPTQQLDMESEMQPAAVVPRKRWRGMLG